MPDAAAADHHLPTRGCAYTVDLADGGGGDSVNLQVWCDMSQLQFAISIRRKARVQNVELLEFICTTFDSMSPFTFLTDREGDRQV